VVGTGRWVVTSAWPYINTVPHLGNLIGSVLSADVFARFLRMFGEDVIFVSGSDEHGTVIEVEARKKGIEPKELTDSAHEYVVKLWKAWNISFDNYTRTENEVHKKYVRDLMLKIYERGFMSRKDQVIPYCPNDKIYLPDRFIEGTCPYCGFEGARGDQCDNCGRLLEPHDLINPRCVFCGSKPEFRLRTHWFFRLDLLEGKILEWVLNHDMLDANVKNFTISWIKTTGLAPRSVTRDNRWGIPAPFPNSEDKTIYVWFDALLGYISATIECLAKQGRENEWVNYWFNGSAKTAYFIGKDNIPFHAVILPAMLIASGDPYNLPTIISATEYLMYEGKKFSKSRRVGVWIDEALKIVDDPDYWRYALIRMRPEDKDTNFRWVEFVRFVNNELNDHIGNYINRTLNLIYRFFNAQVPKISTLDDEDREMLDLIDRSWSDYVNLMSRARIKAASEAIVKLGERGNQYLNRKSPWFKIKEDVESVKTTLYVSFLNSVTIALMLTPITPYSAAKLLDMMGIEEVKLSFGDKPSKFIKENHRIKKPTPIFSKIPQELAEVLIDEEKREKYLEGIREQVNLERPEVLRY